MKEDKITIIGIAGGTGSGIILPLSRMEGSAEISGWSIIRYAAMR